MAAVQSIALNPAETSTPCTVLPLVPPELKPVPPVVEAVAVVAAPVVVPLEVVTAPDVELLCAPPEAPLVVALEALPQAASAANTVERERLRRMQAPQAATVRRPAKAVKLGDLRRAM